MEISSRHNDQVILENKVQFRFFSKHQVMGQPHQPPPSIQFLNGKYEQKYKHMILHGDFFQVG